MTFLQRGCQGRERKRRYDALEAVAQVASFWKRWLVRREHGIGGLFGHLSLAQLHHDHAEDDQ